MGQQRDEALRLYDRTAARTSAGVLAAYSTSFGLGTRLLGRRAQQDIRAVYALVRLADEVVDTYRGQDAGDELDELEAQTHRALRTGLLDEPGRARVRPDGASGGHHRGGDRAVLRVDAGRPDRAQPRPGELRGVRLRIGRGGRPDVRACVPQRDPHAGRPGRRTLTDAGRGRPGAGGGLPEDQLPAGPRRRHPGAGPHLLPRAPPRGTSRPNSWARSSTRSMPTSPWPAPPCPSCRRAPGTPSQRRWRSTSASSTTSHGARRRRSSNGASGYPRRRSSGSWVSPSSRRRGPSGWSRGTSTGPPTSGNAGERTCGRGRRGHRRADDRRPAGAWRCRGDPARAARPGRRADGDVGGRRVPVRHRAVVVLHARGLRARVRAAGGADRGPRRARTAGPCLPSVPRAGLDRRAVVRRGAGRHRELEDVRRARGGRRRRDPSLHRGVDPGLPGRPRPVPVHDVRAPVPVAHREHGAALTHPGRSAHPHPGGAHREDRRPPGAAAGARLPRGVPGQLPVPGPGPLLAHEPPRPRRRCTFPARRDVHDHRGPRAAGDPRGRPHPDGRGGGVDRRRGPARRPASPQVRDGAGRQAGQR